MYCYVPSIPTAARYFEKGKKNKNLIVKWYFYFSSTIRHSGLFSSNNIHEKTAPENISQEVQLV